MQFVVEELRLTDDAGKPARFTPPKEFHVIDGEDAIEIVRKFAYSRGATIIGEVSGFPGSQAIATTRIGNHVYALHAYPETDAEQPR